MYSKPWKSCKKEVRKRLGEKSCPVNDDFLSLIWSCLFEFIYSVWQYPFWSRGEKIAMDKNSSAEVLLCGPLYKEVGVNWFIYNFQLKFPLRLRRHFQIYWIHSWYVQICHPFCRTTGNSKRVSSPETNQALHCTTRNAQAAACPGLISQNGIQTSDGAKRGSEEVDVVHVSSNVDSMARNLDLLSRREYMKEGMAIQYSNDVMFRCLLVCWCRSLFVFSMGLDRDIDLPVVISPRVWRDITSEGIFTLCEWFRTIGRNKKTFCRCYGLWQGHECGSLARTDRSVWNCFFAGKSFFPLVDLLQFIQSMSSDYLLSVHL